MVVASAQDDNGRQLHPREWNHDFIDLPVVKPNEQNTPTLESEQVSEVISKAEGRYKVLYALLAGSGLRIGEALAIEVGEPSDERISGSRLERRCS